MTATTFAHIREVPWYGIGTEVEGHMTPAEAIKAAGLDWTVDKHPVYRNIDGEFVAWANKFENRRSSDGKALGLVSGDFHNLQNVDAFTFADSLVDSGEALIESAGSMRGGKQIFMSMKFPKQMMVAGEDAHDLFLLLRMGHDGSMAITAEVTPIRLACTNMMKLAHTSAQQRWSIRHTSKIEGKLQQAREALKLSWAYAEEFEQIGTTLAGVTVEDDVFVKMMQDVFPSRPTTDEKIDHVMDLFHNSDNIGNFRGTGWGALNAFTEYTDHGRDSKTKEGSFHVLMNGELATQRDAIADRLLALV